MEICVFRKKQAKKLLKVLKEQNLMLNTHCPICFKKITARNLGNALPTEKSKEYLLLCDKLPCFLQIYFKIMEGNNSGSPKITEKALRKLKRFIKKNQLNL